MGTQTAKALRGRRRQAATQLERLLGQVDWDDSIAKARAQRIGRARRLARRRLRGLSAAYDLVTAAEIEVGVALRLIIDEGVSRNGAYRMVGLGRHLGRRYFTLAEHACTQVRPESSTGHALADDPSHQPGDLQPDRIQPDATERRR